MSNKETKYLWSDNDIAEWHPQRFFNKPNTPIMEQLKAFRDVALRMDMVNDVNYYLVNALKHLTEEQKKALADSLYARLPLPIDEHGRDFLGMPVVGNRELLIPVKEIRLFAEYVLWRTGSKLAKFRLAEMYGQYIHDVIKPKYEKK